MKRLVKKVLGDPQIRTVKKLNKRVKPINDLEPKYRKMTDKQLQDQSKKLKERLERESMDDILNEAFALVRETSKRTLGMRHFDVQLVGGMGLHMGSVAEMKTGEGKTLVATLPVYLNGLTGKGVHVVTVNDYLAQRDAGWMGGIYRFLGLSVGVIIPQASFLYDPDYNNEEHSDERMRHLRPCTRQEAYQADVTYGTNNEFGFDYLRDNMVREVDQLRQRELNFAIVDEVDSILIDEARTPLIISAPSTVSGSAYEQFARIVAPLKRDEHYTVDEERRQIQIKDEGVDELEKALGVKSLYTTDNIRTIYHIEQALKAKAIFKRDKDYVVSNDGEVVIVDEFTGRLLKGRRYNEGLHQAIEAKEGVEIQEESMTLATISFQNYFRLYGKLSGMTGTALTEAEEFHQIYKMEVLDIPPNKKVIREDLSDKIYKSERGKYQALVRDVKALQKKGQPVLIGTPSVEKNEDLSRHLKKANIQFNVLNAKNNEREAAIISNAGAKSAVTLATNIAGRGTDIVLDDASRKLGGLHVIGSERHEARRIDNQLRGRGGRQGDPGTSQFYVSCEDHLMRVFGGERIAGIMRRLKVEEDQPIQNRMISRSLEKAQEKVEGFNYDSRKHVVQYDDVMNKHRKAVYAMRKEILLKEDVKSRVVEFIQAEAKYLASTQRSFDEQFEEVLGEVFLLDDQQLDKIFKLEPEKFAGALAAEAVKHYEKQEELFTADIMRKVERDVFMQVLDNLWMQHLETMTHLREGIHWSSVGQRDPLVEYRKRAQVLFEDLQLNLRNEVVKMLFHARPVDQSALDRPVETELTRAARGSVDNANRILSQATQEIDEDDISHNETPSESSATPTKAAKNVKKSRKAERQRKKKARKKSRKKHK